MGLQWKRFSALWLLLLLVPEKATAEGPRVHVTSIGESWINLEIETPFNPMRGRNVDKYRIETQDRLRGEMETHLVDKGMELDPISVTLTGLNPGTNYMLTVTPIYWDMFEGERTIVESHTRQDEISMYGGNGDEQEMMSAGAALTSYKISYFVIFVIFVIVSCI